MSDLLQWLLVVGVCSAAAAAALAWLRPELRRSGTGRLMPAHGSRDVVFLFDGETLLDASPAARAIIPDCTDRSEWAAMTDIIQARFPALPRDPADIAEAGLVRVPSVMEHAKEEVLAENIDGMTRIQIRPTGKGAMSSALNLQRLNDMQSELLILRRVAEHTPHASWQCDESGRITWRNAAYDTLCRKLDKTPGDSVPRIFPGHAETEPTSRRKRCSLTGFDDARVLWFDVSSVPCDEGRLYFAVDVNAVVGAESAQRNFVQTLAKTFAQLSIGLAIFDRNRQLALFNPALIDLTALPADFLSARPNLLSFFDRLRDHRVMPEPKNYASWREQMAELAAAAADGRYSETWTLPSGSTYRVSGRPHPDGAVAFLFEDISAEVTMSRRFRADLEASQTILDHIDVAVAVFSRSGVLSTTNAPFRRMWSIDPDRSFADVTITDVMRQWQHRCRPSPLWGELRDFVLAGEHRTTWNSEAVRDDGVRLECTVRPVPSGGTMVLFRETGQTAEPTLEHSG